MLLRRAAGGTQTRIEFKPSAESAAGQADERLADDLFAELRQRERALAEREQLIATLEARLEHSRRRLEERLAQIKKEKAPEPETFRLPAVAARYFDVGSYPFERDWWSQQLGFRP
jgi:phage shock protein A